MASDLDIDADEVSLAMMTVQDPLTPIFFTLKQIAHPEHAMQPGVGKSLKVFISLNTFRKPNADQCDKSFIGVSKLRLSINNFRNSNLYLIHVNLSTEGIITSNTITIVQMEDAKPIKYIFPFYLTNTAAFP